MTATETHPATVTQLLVKQLQLNGGTQSRLQNSQETIEEYASLLNDKYVFPPINVLFDGVKYWPWDGFHRIFAYIEAKQATIQAIVEPGTQRDAILRSLGANPSHGLPRTNADKRNAVLTVLNDPEWSAEYSNVKIAELCGVKEFMVRMIRQEKIKADKEVAREAGKPAPAEPTTRKVNRGGQTYTMTVDNIGKAGAPTLDEREEQAIKDRVIEAQQEVLDVCLRHCRKIREAMTEAKGDWTEHFGRLEGLEAGFKSKVTS
jgi:hypothetical protein